MTPIRRAVLVRSKPITPTHPSLVYSHAIARVEYDYDANGARTAARTYSASGAPLYAETTPRDERGRIDYKDTPAGRLDYDYYANGLLKDVVSSNTDGVNLGYRYDEINRLAYVDDATNGIPPRTNAYTYNANGSLETVAYANGLAHVYTYDALNRLRGLQVGAVVPNGASLASVLHGYAYNLRASGHRREVVEGAKTTTYTYDDLYRLTGETVANDPHGNNGAVGYTLDKVGNRQNRTSSLSAVPSVLNQTYNARDWLTTDRYDANGNTLNSALLATRYPLLATSSVPDTYDFENRLILRTKHDGTQINLAYDADGLRIQKTLLDVSSSVTSTTTYLVDTNNLTGYAQVFEERTTAGSPAVTTVKTYTYGSDLISVSSTRSSLLTTRYFVYDGGGSVRELADESGTITDRYDYDAFGLLIHRSGPTDNAYLYRGEQWDEDLGLYYLRARFMNSDSGRFWSMDTYEGRSQDPISLHKYTYTHADPVNGTDPSGLLTLAEIMIALGADDIIEASRAIAANRGKNKAIQTLGCAVGAEGIKRWLEVEMQDHHPIPQAMRGPDKNLIPSPVNTHRLFHHVLDILIRSSSDFPNMTGYSSAAKWADALAEKVEKKAMLVLLKQAGRFVDKQCKLPRNMGIVHFIEKNEKEWLSQ